MSRSAPRTYTGRRMAFTLVGFFGVVIAVNVLMASLAGSTFGGVVVQNSYVAGQHFNRWLEQAEHDKALGWSAKASRDGQGRIVVQMAGVPEGTVDVAAEARHPLGRMPDRQLAFRRMADGSFVSTEALPAGRWTLRLDVRAAGERWRAEEAI